LSEQLYIDGIYLPLSKSINPSLTKSITDVAEPDKRKATFSKTTNVPNSKEAQEVFGKIFELNLVNSTFDPTKKADLLYLVNGETILDGYCQLKNIIQLNDKDIEYQIVMFGSIANIFREMGEKYLDHADMVAELDQWNHPFTKEVQAFSWDNQVWDNDLGAFVPFAVGTGYVYILADYGFTTDLDNFDFLKLPCSLYVREYIDALFDSNGFTYTSTFFDSTYFKSLIIPSSPKSYQLDNSEITALQFAANTPQLTSTGTTTSNNLPLSTLSAPDTIIFTNEVSDPSGVYDITNGEYEIMSVTQNGVYDINALIDINATFTPSTGAAVVTTSEIVGYLMVFVNGVQQMAKPFWITYDDGGVYTTGARSTNVTPPSPPTVQNEYLEGPAYSTVPVTLPVVGRNVNPPDRYLMVLNNLDLVIGDIVEIKWKAGYYGAAQSTTNHFQDIGGTNYAGNAVIDISVGSFYNKVINQYPAEGTTLKIEKIIPKEVKQKDFFMSLVKMFNLWIDVDPNNEKNLLIEPRDEFITTDVVDIQEKLAHDKPLNIIPMGKIDASDYLLTYKEDKDYYNEKYTAQWKEIYGQRKIESNNDFVQKLKKIEPTFSPTPIVAPPNSNRPIPTIIALDDQGQPLETDHNIRILYYGGLVDTLNVWNHINFNYLFTIPLPTPYSTYPFAGMVDEPYDWTEDISFGLVKEVYYDDNIDPINITNNNLYNKYYSKQIRQYTDPESKIVTGFFNVRPSDFKNWTFDKLYFFENAYFRLQKIEGYNPTGNELTKCTFLYLTDVPDFEPIIVGLEGDDEGIGLPPGGGDVDDGEVAPVKGTKSKQNANGNNTTGGNKSVDIQGNYNYVAYDSYNININGDGNKVWSEAENIEIHGDDNIIDGGVKNVTLINTNGLTISESNVTYINGVKVDAGTISSPSEVEEISASQDVETDVKAYIVDTSGGDVFLDFNLATITYTEGQIWYFKKDAQQNDMNIRVVGGTIDGNTSLNVKKLNSGIAVIYDGGTEFYIV